MYVFSPANKKRLRTNTAYLQTECLNPKSREARRRQERKAKKYKLPDVPSAGNCYQ